VSLDKNYTTELEAVSNNGRVRILAEASGIVQQGDVPKSSLELLSTNLKKMKIELENSFRRGLEEADKNKPEEQSHLSKEDQLSGSRDYEEHQPNEEESNKKPEAPSSANPGDKKNSSSNSKSSKRTQPLDKIAEANPSEEKSERDLQQDLDNISQENDKPSDRSRVAKMEYDNAIDQDKIKSGTKAYSESLNVEAVLRLRDIEYDRLSNYSDNVFAEHLGPKQVSSEPPGGDIQIIPSGSRPLPRIKSNDHPDDSNPETISITVEHEETPNPDSSSGVIEFKAKKKVYAADYCSSESLDMLGLHVQDKQTSSEPNNLSSIQQFPRIFQNAIKTETIENIEDKMKEDYSNNESLFSHSQRPNSNFKGIPRPSSKDSPVKQIVQEPEPETDPALKDKTEFVSPKYSTRNNHSSSKGGSSQQADSNSDPSSKDNKKSSKSDKAVFGGPNLQTDANISSSVHEDRPKSRAEPEAFSATSAGNAQATKPEPTTIKLIIHSKEATRHVEFYTYTSDSSKKKSSADFSSNSQLSKPENKQGENKESRPQQTNGEATQQNNNGDSSKPTPDNPRLPSDQSGNTEHHHSNNSRRPRQEPANGHRRHGEGSRDSDNLNLALRMFNKHMTHNHEIMKVDLVNMESRIVQAITNSALNSPVKQNLVDLVVHTLPCYTFNLNSQSIPQNDRMRLSTLDYIISPSGVADQNASKEITAEQREKLQQFRVPSFFTQQSLPLQSSIKDFPQSFQLTNLSSEMNAFSTMVILQGSGFSSSQDREVAEKNICDTVCTENTYFSRINTSLQEGQDKGLFCAACLGMGGEFFSKNGVTLKIERVKVTKGAALPKVQFDIVVTRPDGYKILSIEDQLGGSFFV
jgi:hypothetical protein